MNIQTFQCKTKWHWSQVRRCGIFVVICEWFRPVENHKGGVSVNQEHSFKAKNAVKSFLPFLFNDITWKTSLLKTKKWRKMIMCHLTQKGVFLFWIPHDSTKWNQNRLNAHKLRSLMFFSVEALEDHKGGGCRPCGNFLRGGGEGRPSREIPSYTLLHILAEHDHVDQNMR